MIYDAWTYKQRSNNAKLSTYTSTNNNVKVHLHLHWLVHQQLHYKYLRSHNQQITIQIRVLTILSTNININCYIYINQHHLYNMAQQLHTLSHNSSKGENTTLYDKHHIQHLTIIHTSLCNHIKLFIKDWQSKRL